MRKNHPIEEKRDGFLRRIALAVFDTGYKEDADIEIVKVCQLTNLFGLIIALYLTVFATVVLAAGKLPLAVFDYTMGAAAFLNYLLFRRFRHCRSAVNTVVTITTLVSLSMTATGGLDGSGLVWIVLYPLVVLPLKGAFRGALCAFVFLGLVVLIYFFGDAVGFYNYSVPCSGLGRIYSRIIFVYMAISLVAYIFVRNRHGLYREIKKLSLTDPLTLLPNRRSINVMIDYHVNLFRRRVYPGAKRDGNDFNVPFSCILCDIDDFKSINDTYGHDSGDSVLKEFAALLKASLRGADFVGRWGGEEFIIILGGTYLDQAAMVARKLVATVERYDFILSEGSGLHLTMSCGVAAFSKEDDEIDLFRDLDRNLYLAKDNGKNSAYAAGKIV